MEKIVPLEEIKKRIPHRYENLLIDNLTYVEDHPELSLKITPDDPLGRHLFFKQRQRNERSLLNCFLMEILALGAIISEGRVPTDSLIVYVGIYNFKFENPFPLDNEIKGRMTRGKGRTGFIRQKGELHNGDTHLCQGDMMASLVKKSVLNAGDPTTGKYLDPPQIDREIPIVKDPEFKAECMYIIDTLTHMNFEDGSVVSKYTFPEDHPLVKGHFPSNPILMGVMQWMGVEDALWAFSQHENRIKSGRTLVTADADLINEKGLLISECKGFTGIIHKNDGDFLDQCEVQGTKKLNFRGSISPGETVFIRVHSIQFS
jgi:3-hydroxymyristoyl/3-hydroxydecanoyl-(acyl carrier protein) dehydratase